VKASEYFTVPTSKIKLLTMVNQLLLYFPLSHFHLLTNPCDSRYNIWHQWNSIAMQFTRSGHTDELWEMPFLRHLRHQTCIQINVFFLIWWALISAHPTTNRHNCAHCFHHVAPHLSYHNWFISIIFKCTVNGRVLLTDVFSTFLETLQRIMFVFRMWADTSKLWKCMCDILRANFLNN